MSRKSARISLSAISEEEVGLTGTFRVNFSKKPTFFARIGSTLFAFSSQPPQPLTGSTAKAMVTLAIPINGEVVEAVELLQESTLADLPKKARKSSIFSSDLKKKTTPSAAAPPLTRVSTGTATAAKKDSAVIGIVFTAAAPADLTQSIKKLFGGVFTSTDVAKVGTDVLPARTLALRASTPGRATEVLAELVATLHGSGGTAGGDRAVVRRGTVGGGSSTSGSPSRGSRLSVPGPIVEGGARTPSRSPRGSVIFKQKDGEMRIGSSRTNYFFVIRDGHLRWYRDRKSQGEEVGSLPLMDASIDGLEDIVFVQVGPVVHDFTAKSKRDATEWVEALRPAALLASQVEKKTPLFQYRVAATHRVQVIINLGESSIRCYGNTSMTPAELKDTAWATARAQGLVDDSVSFHNPEFYFLKVAGSNRIIVYEDRPLSDMPFCKVLLRSFVPILLETISKMEMREGGVDFHEMLEEQQRLYSSGEDAEMDRENDVEALCDESLFNNLASNIELPNNEMNVFRARIAKFRLDEHSKIVDRLPEFVRTDDLAEDVELPDVILCSVDLPNQSSVATISMPSTGTVAQLQAQVRSHITKIGADEIAVGNEEEGDLVLKVMGKRSYMVSPDQPLLSYDYVQKQLVRGARIELAMVRTQHRMGKETVAIADGVLAAQLGHLGVTETSGKVEPRSVALIPGNLRLRVAALRALSGALDGISKDVDVATATISLEVAVHFGRAELCAPRRTKSLKAPRSSSDVCSWDTKDWLEFDLPVSAVPVGARISLTVYVDGSGPVAWVGVQLYTHELELKQGSMQVRLWPGGPADPTGTCVENFADKQPARLYLELASYEQPIVYQPPKLSVGTHRPEPTADAVEAVNALVERDGLASMTQAELELLWHNRTMLMERSSALVKVLQAVSWSQPQEVAEMHALLRAWARPTPYEALDLFDASFSDPIVRAYAVDCLSALTDADLSDILLQLTQVLKYEPFHDSALARFLLRRALASKEIIGVQLFWYLKAETHVPEISLRFLLLIEAYVRGCGPTFRTVLLQQVSLLDQLTRIASALHDLPNEGRLPYLRGQLAGLNLPERFTLPLFTDVEFGGLIVDKCRFMRSKKLPLWLEFENADRRGKSIKVMYKVGDDLRQDVLTLQMIRLMDKLWQHDGMDLRMRPYGVISTGDERGLVEVVPDSQTTAGCNREYGGAMQVWASDTMTKWLRSYNESDEDFAEAQKTFALSSAGYCVATFVLGIGDRHNDNIMVTYKGNLFHIDFGHFLGHFKSKFGYEREAKDAFVFTDQYLDILGGKGAPSYNLFVSQAVRAYNIVRKNASLFIALFKMMLSIGLEELKSVENIKYLRDKMRLDLPDAEAVGFFMGRIDAALESSKTKINDFVHLIKHG